MTTKDDWRERFEKSRLWEFGVNKTQVKANVKYFLEKEITAAYERGRREGAWIGFNAAGEGYNGEYVRKGVTGEMIRANLDEALFEEKQKPLQDK